MKYLRKAIFLRGKGERASKNFSITELTKRIFDLFFPDGCLICGRACSDDLCRSCEEYVMEMLSLPGCPVCGQPFFGNALVHLCPSCEKEKNRPFKVLFFSLPYTERTKGVLLRFKYGGDMSALRLIPRLLPRIPEVDAVIPVPVHHVRLRSRGFNQSALIAREVARCIGSRLFIGAVSRIKPTRPLTGLSPSERRSEVKDAFSVRPGVFNGMKVLLVDDVYTTGSTLGELSKVILKVGGAEEVFLYTLFRTY